MHREHASLSALLAIAAFASPTLAQGMEGVITSPLATKEVPWPAAYAVQDFHSLRAWDPWGDQRTSAVVHFDDSLYLCFEPQVYKSVTQLPTPSAVADMLPMAQPTGGDKLLVTCSGQPCLLSYGTNGTVTTSPTLSLAWEDADLLCSYTDSNGLVTVIARAASGQDILRASAMPGAPLVELTPHAVGQSIDQLIQVDWNNDSTPDCLAMTTSGYAVFDGAGGPPLVVSVAWFHAYAAGIRTPAGDFAVLLDFVPGIGTVAMTMNSVTYPIPVVLNETLLQLSAPMALDGVGTADSDGDGLEDDIIVSNSEGHSVLILSDTYGTPQQRGVDIGSGGCKTGPTVCLQNFDNDGDDDLIAWDPVSTPRCLRLARGVEKALATVTEYEHWIVEGQYDYLSEKLYLLLNPAVDPADPVEFYTQVDALVWFEPVPDGGVGNVAFEAAAAVPTSLPDGTFWLELEPMGAPVVMEDGFPTWPGGENYFVQLRFFRGGSDPLTLVFGMGLDSEKPDPHEYLMGLAPEAPPSFLLMGEYVEPPGRPVTTVGVIVLETEIPPIDGAPAKG